jgi:hypothetical protein
MVGNFAAAEVADDDVEISIIELLTRVTGRRSSS